MADRSIHSTGHGAVSSPETATIRTSDANPRFAPPEGPMPPEIDLKSCLEGDLGAWDRFCNETAGVVMAAILGVGEQTIRSTKHKALERLRKAMPDPELRPD